MSKGPLACVIGDLDLIRPLGLAGISSAVVTKGSAPPRFSRFAHTWIRWEPPEDSTDSLVKSLLEFGRAQEDPPVLFYQDDPEMLAISRHRDALGEVFRFLMPDEDLIESLGDKSRFSALSERAGLPVPKSAYLAAGEPAPPGLRDLGLPVIVKPAHRAHEWGRISGRQKALVLSDHDELESLRRDTSRAGIDLVAQQHIAGPESRIESYHAYVDEHAEIAGEFTGEKIRTHPPSCGYSTAVRITATTDVAELGRSCLQRIGLRGVAKVDFKRDAEGRLWLLEVNPRFNLWHHPGAAAGVNLPALVYADLVGRPRGAPPHARAGVTWCSLRTDNWARREAGIGIRPWLRWAARSDVKWTLAWDDPMPLLAGIFGRRVRERAQAWRSGHRHAAGEEAPVG